ncbi:LpqN/LpqT family lipoprotein [Mycobacterium hubeiense]|uniref:LpqN/LpqT family lipoprotein n=1 Tax=Mycobacterium hubeiense TaxID=1867256 RepID=UPI000C7EB3FA|nr:LpqN/LpqT family lipoprotein [Mycobacterium sp. QGD 101]
MKKPVLASRIVIAAVVVGMAVAGCSTDTKTEAPAAQETTTASPQASGPRYTIPDYIKENGIVDTRVRRGDPGSPTVNLPIPPGWQDAGPRTREWAWQELVFTDPTVAQDPPRIIAQMSKLTGNVDPAKILEFAPGELQNLPGWEGGNGNADKLGGFDAWQTGGMYIKDGARRAIAQKTVVIPGQDGLYVLQLQADGLRENIGALMDATAVIDDQTTITP